MVCLRVVRLRVILFCTLVGVVGWYLLLTPPSPTASAAPFYPGGEGSPAFSTAHDWLWWGKPDRTFAASARVGLVSSAPITGDFDGDGVDDIFWYQPGSAVDYIWWGNPQRGYASSQTQVTANYVPFAGDFDGDGRDDIFWYRAGGDPDYVWWANADRTFTDQEVQVSASYVPIAGDFDGDGRDDIFWYRAGSNPDYLWWAKGDRTFTSQEVQVSASYVPIAGDFDGNGVTDLFWYRAGSDPDYVWWWTAQRTYTSVERPVAGSYVPLAGDFDSNGTTDIFWYASGAATHPIWWWSSNRTYSTQPVQAQGQYAPFTGDFDGNGTSDIFWYRGAASGATATPTRTPTRSPTPTPTPTASPTPTPVITGTPTVDYAGILAAEAAWLTSLQFDMPGQNADGAIVLYRSATGDSQMIPDFGNMAARALLARPEYAPRVRRYMDWYFRHLNWPDFNGVYGTVYDYYISPTGVETVRMGGEHPHYDSTDGYAASFIQLVRRYYEVTGDAQYLIDNRYFIELIGGAMRATQQPDGLTWARPDYLIKYLMDNAGVYVAFADLEWLATEVYQDAPAAAYWRTYKEQVATGIEQRLWSPQHQMYLSHIGTQGTGPVPRWEVAYPDALAQLSSIGSVIPPTSSRAQHLYDTYNLYYPDWPTLETGNFFPGASQARQAAMMGDRQRADTFLRTVEARYISTGHPWPWNGSEAALTILAIEELLAEP